MSDNAPEGRGAAGEHADLERQLSDPTLHADAGAARRVGRRFAQISPIVSTYRKLEAARGDLGGGQGNSAEDDESFAAEMTRTRGAASPTSTPNSPTCWRRAIRTTPTTSCSR